MKDGIANRILRVQEDIDLMRKEIIQVVSKVLGYVEPKHEGTVAVSSGSGCVWKVKMEYRESGSDYYGYDISPRCYSQAEPEVLLFSKDVALRTPSLISPENMAVVHASLDSFIEGVYRAFPDTKTKIEAFLKGSRMG